MGNFMRIRVGLLVVCSLMCCGLFGQCKCTLQQLEDVSRGTPVIWGKPYEVPALHLEFRDESTGMPCSPTEIMIHYCWEWLQYPATERPWGAWTDTSDLLICNPNGETDVEIPIYLVKPRGWYDGKYTKFPWPKTPHFDRIEIMFSYNGCESNVIWESKDLKKFRDSKAIITLPCGGHVRVEYAKLSK